MLQGSKQLPGGVVVGKMSEELYNGVASTPDAVAMLVQPGTKLEEHTHENSMYFAKGVKSLTINGKHYTLPGDVSWAFIPEGVSHGWADTISQKIGKVFSYHPDHDNPVVVPV